MENAFNSWGLGKQWTVSFVVYCSVSLIRKPSSSPQDDSPTSCRTRGHFVLKKEEHHPWRENPPNPNVGVCARGQGLCKVSLSHTLLFKKGCSHVVPAARNSPWEPQMAGYIYKITTTPAAQSPERRHGGVCLPSKGVWRGNVGR